MRLACSRFHPCTLTGRERKFRKLELDGQMTICLRRRAQGPVRPGDLPPDLPVPNDDM
jgi:hypothetical protein